jgi:2-polyprenyl-3-methyl-5-hydroxy-6-metoxy-1,4-benzoquinol methylase
MRDAAAARVAEQLPTRFLRGYAGGKLKSDPVYRATATALRDRAQPLFDIGCGIGLLEFYLRETGFSQPMTGIDHDARKVEVARTLGAQYAGLTFIAGDARAAIPADHNITALDVLHYFTEPDQRALVQSIVDAVPAGGVAIIRDAIRDGSMRYRVTALQEMFSRAIRWLKAERLNFPTRELIMQPFLDRGFSVQITPAWGATPFNNYLFVCSRPSSGTTKA